MGRTFAQLPGYEIQTRIGRGAGAVIYSALERPSRRRVAVKHVVRHGPADDRWLEQAETEYEVSRQFAHPALRKCYELVRVRRWLKTAELFLIMEFIDGERLEVLFAAGRPDPLSAVIEIFVRVAEGLEALHRGGHAHADIKPNNILITPGGEVKIIDFGQSCPLGHVKQRIQGTPDFIAPEQVRRLPIDHRTDVFNLGATMYWAFTGKAYATILPAAQTGDLKMDVDATRNNRPPAELDSAIPVALSRLIMDCCEADRDARPRDMQAVRSRLEMTLQLLARRSAAEG